MTLFTFLVKKMAKPKNLNQTSSSRNLLKLRIKIGEFEFEAEGEASRVVSQFEWFQSLVSPATISPSNFEPPHVAPPPGVEKKSLANPSVGFPPWEQLFETDPHSSILLCRLPPSGKESEAKLILLLLLGYLEIRKVTEVPVVALKHAIKYSLRPVLRLDRIVREYVRDRFLIKIGRGKGGKYRLTSLGISKAQGIAEELSSKWNGV